MANAPMKKQAIANAILWAAMMLASALVIKDDKAASTMLMLLVVGWFGSSMLFGNMREQARAECRAVKRMFKGSAE